MSEKIIKCLSRCLASLTRLSAFSVIMRSSRSSSSSWRDFLLPTTCTFWGSCGFGFIEAVFYFETLLPFLATILTGELLFLLGDAAAVPWPCIELRLTPVRFWLNFLVGDSTDEAVAFLVGDTTADAPTPVYSGLLTGLFAFDWSTGVYFFSSSASTRIPTIWLMAPSSFVAVSLSSLGSVYELGGAYFFSSTI